MKAEARGSARGVTSSHDTPHVRPRTLARWPGAWPVCSAGGARRDHSRRSKQERVRRSLVPRGIHTTVLTDDLDPVRVPGPAPGDIDPDRARPSCSCEPSHARRQTWRRAQRNSTAPSCCNGPLCPTPLPIQVSGPDHAGPHSLRVIADLDPGDLAPGPEGDHRDAVVAGHGDEAVPAVALDADQ